MRVCQGIWNNVKVNKTHTQTRTLTHTWTHRMSEWNVKIIIFQRKLEVSKLNLGIDLSMQEQGEKTNNMQDVTLS